MKWLMASAFYFASVVGAVAQQDEIRGTISDQFTAFLNDDFVTAFTFASPRLRDYFGSPEVFSRMVTQGYPMVWRHKETRFLELREQGGYFLQQVLIIDESGGRHLLEYRMIPTEEGWRIAGVQILQAPEVNA